MLTKSKNIYYGFLVGLFSLSIFTIYALKSNNILMNIENINKYNTQVGIDVYGDNHKLNTILPNEILTNDIDFEKDIQKTLTYVATVIDGRYISNPNLTAYQKLNNIITKNGGGICGDLAMILQEILIVKGYKSRTLQLVRQIGSSYDTHVVTEVWNEKLKKFILLDPTFNLMFTTDDKYINANELRDSYLYKKNNFKIVDFSVKKVAKYKEYYVDYLSLYNNVLIVKVNTQVGYQRLMAKLPILHSYLGRKYYIENNNSLNGIAILYKIFYIYVPLFLLLNIMILILLKINNRNKREI